MTLLKMLQPGGRDGISSRESRDAIGYAVAALSRVAQSDLIDRLGLREQTQALVHRGTRDGFGAVAKVTTASRSFTRSGKGGAAGTRVPSTSADGVFDLTPTEDQQMLVDVVTEFAAQVVRPAATEADEACATPEPVLKASLEIGLPILGIPETLGGISEERSAVSGVLVAEALAHGDMGIAVGLLASGSVATAIGLWGTDEQQQTYLPAFTGTDVPAAALALSEPAVLFDVLRPQTTAVRRGDQLVLNGLKALVPLGTSAELFVVGAVLEGQPVLVLLESSTPGLSVADDPSMGVRASSLARLTLTDVTVPVSSVLGSTDGSTYRECVRLSRLAWCALAVGVGQAVLDYVTPYVKERKAFGEPIANRQSVAFMVANIAIELQAMRLLTYKAAARAAAGKDFTKELALARRACGDHGMRIGLDGVQLLGGHGFVKEHPVERWYRDLRAIGLADGAVLV